MGIRNAGEEMNETTIVAAPRVNLLRETTVEATMKDVGVSIVEILVRADAGIKTWDANIQTKGIVGDIADIFEKVCCNGGKYGKTVWSMVHSRKEKGV